MSYAIETVDLTKRYGPVEALKSLSLQVPAGQVLAFLGPNSAGKTTTLKILAGIMPGSSGQATVAGFSAAYQGREIKRHVGYMPEHNPLPEEATVEEFLSYRARLKELSGKHAQERVKASAALCDLTGKLLKRPIGVLSRGVRQRVGIADALLIEPPILILDEPTIGLDPHQVMSLRDLIGRMRGKHTVILSTHILSEAEVMADRILIINKGKKVAYGSVEELREQYAGGNSLRIVTNFTPQRMEAMVRRMGGAVDTTEDLPGHMHRYVCRLPGPAAVQQLLHELTQSQDTIITEFVKSSPTLESIFMRATVQRDDL